MSLKSVCFFYFYWISDRFAWRTHIYTINSALVHRRLWDTWCRSQWRNVAVIIVGVWRSIYTAVFDTRIWAYISFSVSMSLFQSPSCRSVRFSLCGCCQMIASSSSPFIRRRSRKPKKYPHTAYTCPNIGNAMREKHAASQKGKMKRMPSRNENLFNISLFSSFWMIGTFWHIRKFWANKVCA